MIDLKVDSWVEAEILTLPDVKAEFRRLKVKDYNILHNVELGSVLSGEAADVIALVKNSVRNIQGVEVDGKSATVEDVFESGGIAVISGFVTTLITAQYSSFLAES